MVKLVEFMQVMGKTPEVSKSDIDELTSSFKVWSE